MHRIYITAQNVGKGEHSEEISDQSKTKSRWTNSTLCISPPEVKMLFRSPILFSFADRNTLLSLLLFVFPGSSSPWHDPGISNILILQGNPGFNFTASHTMASLGLHSGIPLTHSWPRWLSLISEANSTTPFFCP